MLVLLPLTCFVAIFLVFQNATQTASWRSSFLAACLIWAGLLTGITEVLSLFNQITLWAILGAWVLSVVLALIYLIRFVGGVKKVGIRWNLATLSRIEFSFVSGLIFIGTLTGMIALISPPNNWDSLTYHMSRVAHWIQNQSVESYPTNIMRQLYQSPWGEFVIMHFQILSGGDHFANLVQWFSMMGTTLGVSLLAKQLGANPRGQIFAALFGATLPMGILQAESTQTDYVVSFWLVCMVHYSILLKADGRSSYALATGASLGLAILTKGTAYIYAFPFMAWLSFSLVKSNRANGVLQIILALMFALLVNLGHYQRTYSLYGNPLGYSQEGGAKFSNDLFTFSSFSSNAIRNIALHLSTPFKHANVTIERIVFRLHRYIGISANDQRTTWAGEKFHIGPRSLHEDVAGNPLHLFLAAISLPALFVRLRKNEDSGYYFLCLLAAFAIFSFYLRWQPWHSRLHLPLFILWSPLIGIWFFQVWGRGMANASMLILLLTALPYMLRNPSRPLVGKSSILTKPRIEQYFANRPSLYKPYSEAVQFLRDSKCSDIGLILNANDWEYPFWVLLAEEGPRSFRLEHVNAVNISQEKYGGYPFNTFTPCAVIAVSSDSVDEIRVGAVAYSLEWFSSPVGVFVRK